MWSSGVSPDAATAACNSAVALLRVPGFLPAPRRAPPCILNSLIVFQVSAALDAPCIVPSDVTVSASPPRGPSAGCSIPTRQRFRRGPRSGARRANLPEVMPVLLRCLAYIARSRRRVARLTTVEHRSAVPRPTVHQASGILRQRTVANTGAHCLSWCLLFGCLIDLSCFLGRPLRYLPTAHRCEASELVLVRSLI